MTRSIYRFHDTFRFFLSFLHAVTQKWHIFNTMLVFFLIADSYDCVENCIQVSLCRNALILSLIIIRKFCSSSIHSIILCLFAKLSVANSSSILV